MDEPPSGLPPEAFASSPQHQHLHHFTRFHIPPPSSVRGVQQQHQRRQQVVAAPQPPHPPPVTPTATSQAPFAPHLDPGLQPLDPNDAFPPSFDTSPLGDITYGGDNYPIPQQLYAHPAPSPTTPISHHHHPQHQQHHRPQQQQQQHHHHHQQHPHHHHQHSQHGPRTPQSLISQSRTPRDEEEAKNGGQLGVLVPHKQLDSPLFLQNNAVARLRQEQALEDAGSGGVGGGAGTGAGAGAGAGDSGGVGVGSRVRNTGNASGAQDGSHKGGPKQGGHFPGMKSIPDPPNLEGWRQVLFSVDKAIELTEDEFQTYFPHVDNVYSHRSTQRYKKQPFVSHYWDCRLKGRPPGTPKSEDPSKRKRKRQARERDLCDVKIKITEYFVNARNILGNHPVDPDPDGQIPGAEPMQDAGLVDSSRPVPGADGKRYYQIQRVNGNGGNGKADGIAGPHKHDLHTSDDIKKNSIQRALAKDEKEKKKAEKTFHRKATGMALATVKRHSKDDGMKLYGCCFCPFTQRVWITLELKGIPYQYIEVDPTAKPQELFDKNADGQFPALRHNGWTCTDSATLVEYLDDLHATPNPLLPTDPQARAFCRAVGAQIRQELVPAYYRLLEAQDDAMQAERGQALQNVLQNIVNIADYTGPFFLGSQASFVDIMLAPWIIRMKRILKAYRAWQEPPQGSRWHAWIQHIEAMDAVKKTTSSDELYKESFERFSHEVATGQAIIGSVGTETFPEGAGLP